MKTPPDILEKEKRISRLRSAISQNWNDETLCEQFRAEIVQIKKECAEFWDARVNYFQSKRLEGMGY